MRLRLPFPSPALRHVPRVMRAAVTAFLLAGWLALMPGGGPIDFARAAQASAPQDAPTALTVLAAGDMRGEIEPCGCAPEGQQGGLPRRLSYLEQALAAPGPAPILVDLGNNFPEPTAQGRHKIALIRTLLAHFAPQAVLPGPGELALGVPELDDGLPYVVSNDAAGGTFTPVRPVTRTLGGTQRRVGIYGYLSPQAVYQGPQVPYRLRLVDDALLADWRRALAAAGYDAAILLFRGSDAELAAIAGAGLFDLIVAGNPSADEMHQVTARDLAGLRVPQVPTKGQGVLHLRLAPGAPGTVNMPADAPVDVVWLGDRWPDHPAAAPVFAAYDEQVKRLFFARLETMEQREKASPYVGAAACQTCHLAQQQKWATTRHSHALATLERVGKQYDPECLACHVVGLNKEGFLSKDLTPQFANVQCENCHGPARAHTANPTVKPGPVPSAGGGTLPHPGEATCRTCHKGSHSPGFDFAVYWPKVAHPNPPQAARR